MNSYRNNIFLGLAGLAVLAGLFIVLSPKGNQPGNHSSSNQTATPNPVTPAPATETQPVVISVQVAGGKLVMGPETTTVSQGQEVQLRVTSDVADELHLHGYDKKLPLVAGTAATLTFTAENSGRYEYELHGSETVIGVIEVQPKS